LFAIFLHVSHDFYRVVDVLEHVFLECLATEGKAALNIPFFAQNLEMIVMHHDISAFYVVLNEDVASGRKHHAIVPAAVGEVVSA
jgi:hypothetical protein